MSGRWPPRGSSVTKDPAELEGPWYSHEEYIAAKMAEKAISMTEKQSALPRSPLHLSRYGGQEDDGQETPLVVHGGTFALTETGSEVASNSRRSVGGDSGRSRRTSSRRDKAPGHASRNEYGWDRAVDVRVDIQRRDMSTQCRPMELEENPLDSILRRYSFSLEWDHGTLAPGFLSTGGQVAAKDGKHNLMSGDEMTCDSTAQAAKGQSSRIQVDDAPNTSAEELRNLADPRQSQVHKVALYEGSQASGHQPPEEIERPKTNAGQRVSTSMSGAEQQSCEVVRSERRPSTAAAGSSGRPPLHARSKSPICHTVQNARSKSPVYYPGNTRSKSPISRAMHTHTPPIDMKFYEVKMTEKEVGMPFDYTADYRRYSYTDFKIPKHYEGKSTIEPDLISDWIDRAVPRNQDDVHPLFVLCKDLLRKFHLKEIRYAVRKEQDLLASILQLRDQLQGNMDREYSWKQEQEKARLKLENERNSLQQQIKEMQSEIESLRAELQKYARLQEEMNDLIACQAAEHEELLRLRQLMAEKDSVASIEAEKFRKEIEALKADLDAHKRHIKFLEDKAPMQHVEEWDLEAKVSIFKHFFTPSTVCKWIAGPDAVDSSKEVPDENLQVTEHVAASMTETEFVQLPEAMKLKFTQFNITDLKQAAEKGLSRQTWLEVLSSLLGVKANALFQHVFEVVKEDTALWSSMLTTHLSGVGEGWEIARASLKKASIKMDSLRALEVLCGVDEMVLMANLVGIDPKYIPMIREHWGLFLKWFERFGSHGEKGLDEAQEEARKIREKAKKYGLLDMEHMVGEPFTLEETLHCIGEIIDFKFKSDWENEGEQRPRLNMVRALKSYMLHKHVKRDYNDQVKRFCSSVLKWAEINVRVKLFGMCAGMLEILHCWTERATCIWMIWLKEVKKLSSPGLESQDPSTQGQSWDIFAPWLGTAEKVVELEYAVQAVKAAVNSDYAFGDMPEIEPMLESAVVRVPGMTAGISLDKAMEIFMQAWFVQFENAKKVLVDIFHHFDDNDDGALDMQEFLGMLKHTPLKIRQHDAMSMFTELAGVLPLNSDHSNALVHRDQLADTITTHALLHSYTRLISFSTILDKGSFQNLLHCQN
jgi:hypothetical protein